MGKRRRHSSSDHDIGPSVKQTASDTYTQREPDSPVYSELDSSSDSSSSSSSDSSYQRKKLKKKKHAKKHKSRHSDSSQHSRKKMKKKEKKKKKKKKKKSSKSDTCRTVEAESAPGPLPAGGAIDQSTVSKSLAASSSSSSSSANIPETAAGRRLQAPMSKAEWEKQQSIVRRVYDPTTGRDRLVKGDGEILEEIVSKGRHKQINKQATLGDGLYYQSQAQLHR